MNARWLAHLDAHIATGQVAAEAESAEVLSWLLKLEPEQRWCLILSRDPCLERLLALDYRRLLTLMVELEAGAIANAPPSSEPCVDFDAAPEGPPTRALIHAPPAAPPAAPARLAPSWLAAAFLLSLAGGAGGFWLMHQERGQRLAALEQDARSLLQTVESRQALMDDMNSQLARATSDQARQNQTLRTFTALDALTMRLTTGRPFTDELAALRAVWDDPALLAPLDALAGQGLTPPAVLLETLARLRDRLATGPAELREQARAEGLGASELYARVEALAARRAATGRALDLARQGDWPGAADALAGIHDPACQAWREQVAQWLRADAALTRLFDRLWSDWTADAQPATPP